MKGEWCILLDEQKNIKRGKTNTSHEIPILRTIKEFYKNIIQPLGI